MLVDWSIGHLVRDVAFFLVYSGMFLRIYVGLYVYVLLTDLNNRLVIDDTINKFTIKHQKMDDKITHFAVHVPP